MGAWRAAALASQFGFSVVGSLVVGVVLGQYLDRQLGTAPLCFLIGLVGGFVTSIYLIYLIYRMQIQPRRPNAAGSEEQL
jgi:F0F1-type ATP synthase assembly protein I